MKQLIEGEKNSVVLSTAILFIIYVVLCFFNPMISLCIQLFSMVVFVTLIARKNELSDYAENWLLASPLIWVILILVFVGSKIEVLFSLIVCKLKNGTRKLINYLDN